MKLFEMQRGPLSRFGILIDDIHGEMNELLSVLPQLENHIQVYLTKDEFERAVASAFKRFLAEQDLLPMHLADLHDDPDVQDEIRKSGPRQKDIANMTLQELANNEHWEWWTENYAIVIDRF